MLVTADDIARLSAAIGAGGFAIAKRLFPQYDDPLRALGSVQGANASVVEYGDGLINRTVISLAARQIDMSDQAGVVAYGGTKVYTFPEGNIHILGAVLNIPTLVKSGAGINADFDGDVSVGSVTASNNNSLTSTEANIIPSTSTPQAASGSTTGSAVSTAAVQIDGTATPVDVYLNFLIDDADQDITGGGASSLLATGTLTLLWANLGDK